MIFGWLAGWTDKQREMAVVVLSRLWSVGWTAFPGASCHLPTEVLSWFELVLAETLSAAYSTLVVIPKQCDFSFFLTPTAQNCE